MPRTVNDFSDAIVKVDLDEQDRQAQVIISKSNISPGSQWMKDSKKLIQKLMQELNELKRTVDNLQNELRTNLVGWNDKKRISTLQFC